MNQKKNFLCSTEKNCLLALMSVTYKEKSTYIIILIMLNIQIFYSNKWAVTPCVTIASNFLRQYSS
jgi:hypothetical protein